MDPALIKKYNTAVPRYTSYPTALSFQSGFTQSQFIQAIQGSGRQELSLYLHIPFCHSLCYYCGCNKVVTRQPDKADIYLNYLENEILLQAPLFRRYQVVQLHFGGGSPSFLSVTQLQRLMGILRTHFRFRADAQLSIEIDPRGLRADYLDDLHQLGFRRLSIGVQDTNQRVQQAINRVQSTECVAKLVERAQQLGFTSVNLDLIVGLPWQDRQTFSETLQAVISMRPQRLSLFSYAHMPQRFAAQRKIHFEWLPSAQEKNQLTYLAIDTLMAAGYEFIGMDHFALADDELAVAQKSGQLQRNFQGYTTHGDCDLLGLGVSAISAIGNIFSQNHSELTTYYQQLDSKDLALNKGLTLSADDQVRAEIIKQLMCNGMVYIPAIEQQFKLSFADYFADEIDRLAELQHDALVDYDGFHLQVLPRGRLFVRQVARVFDVYTRAGQQALMSNAV